MLTEDREGPIPEAPPLWKLGCDGSLGCTCQKLKKRFERKAYLRPHGTRSRYIHGLCRCQWCTYANTEYKRQWRERRKDQDGTS